MNPNENPEVAPLRHVDRWSGVLEARWTGDDRPWHFGVVMLVGLTVLAALVYLPRRDVPGLLHEMVALAAAGTGLLLLLWSLAAPNSIRPIRAAWLAFGERMGAAVGTVVVGLVFVLVVVPLGVAMRLARVDPLGRKEEESYWKARWEEPDADHYLHMS